MVRRYIFAKLSPEHATGLNLVKLLGTARDVLHAGYCVQGLHIGHAADDATKQSWDICFTLEFASYVDLQRSSQDTVIRTFLKSFLEPRTEAVWTAAFEGESAGPRRR